MSIFREKMVDKIFVNKKNGMEAKILGETVTCIIAGYKHCLPFIKPKSEFVKEFEPLLDGQGRCSFSRLSPPPPKGMP